MKITVFSPTRGQGTTTASILIGTALSKVCDLDVVLTHTCYKDPGIKSYLNLDEIVDPTRSLAVVLALIRSSAISGDDLINYSIPKGDKFSIVDTVSSNLSEDESDIVIDYVTNSLSKVIGILDSGAELDTLEKIEKAYNSSDMLMCVVDANRVSFDIVRDWTTDEEYGYMFNSGKIIFLVNNYNPILGNLRSFSKYMRIAHQYVYKLNYNPYITKYCNEGELQKILDFISIQHFTTLDIAEDLKKCCTVFSTGLDLGIKWRY